MLFNKVFLEIILQALIDLLSFCLFLFLLGLFHLFIFFIYGKKRKFFCKVLDRIEILFNITLLSGLHDLINVPLDFSLEVHRVIFLGRHLNLWNTHRMAQNLAVILGILRMNLSEFFILVMEETVLLLMCKRSVKHLKLERPFNIRSLAKPENDLITEISTFIRLSRLMI